LLYFTALTITFLFVVWKKGAKIEK